MADPSTRGSQPLSEGDVLILGTPDERGRSTDRQADPARQTGREPSSGDEYIGLPTAEDPSPRCIAGQPGDEFSNEQGVRSVSHREQVVVGGTIWRLFLPGTSLRTEEDRERQVGIGEIRIEFTVSSDEEDVDIVVEHGERRTPLKSRSHHYLLLTLARERIAAARDGVPAAEQGWVYQDDLCRMLALEASVVYLQVHRARRQFEAAGIQRAFDLVERRTGSGQIRIGVPGLHVQRATSED